jgi:hypothetical protein
VPVLVRQREALAQGRFRAVDEGDGCLMLGYEENRAVDIVFRQVRANDTQPRLLYDRHQVGDRLDAQLQAVSLLLGDGLNLLEFVFQAGDG